MKKSGWLFLVLLVLMGNGCATNASPEPELDPCAHPPENLAPNSLEALTYQQQCGNLRND